MSVWLTGGWVWAVCQEAKGATLSHHFQYGDRLCRHQRVTSLRLRPCIVHPAPCCALIRASSSTMFLVYENLLLDKSLKYLIVLCGLWDFMNMHLLITAFSTCIVQKLIPIAERRGAVTRWFNDMTQRQLTVNFPLLSPFYLLMFFTWMQFQ